MNLRRSMQGLGRIWSEDAAFRALGRPPGWSVLAHYRGRWHDRRGTPLQLEKVPFRFEGRSLEFELNSRYLGAFKGVFIDREYDCRAVVGPPPARILDLGGNIGFGSVFLAQLFPAATFAVVEPDPRNVPLLRRNLSANGVRATVIDAAIGAEQGTLRLRWGLDPACSSLAGTGLHDLAGSTEVRVVDVPEVLRLAGWDRVDLVKIDIEGAEEELLARNNAWLERVEALLIEVHPNTTVERLNRYVAPHGFKFTRFGAGREPVYWARRQP